MLINGEILKDTYQIIEPIGEGGAGVVYLAYHIRLKKKIVVKKIKDKYIGRINERQEADILKNLNCTGLPKVYDFLEIDSGVYIVMDYIPGRDLSEYIKRGVHFEEKQIVIWLKRLVEILVYLHGQNPPIIHRDIKPSNIMITPNGEAYLIDFNVSIGECTEKRISGFSKKYASPEQLQQSQFVEGGEKRIEIDARSDIFSLGATFFHLMAGNKVFESNGISDVQTLKELPYSEWLLHIIGKAITPSLKKRYQSSEQMLGDIVQIRKRDKEYRRAALGQAALNVMAGCILSAGLVAFVIGIKELNREEFLERYQAAIQIIQNGDTEKVIEDAIDILNDKKYGTILKEEPKEKADLLYMIANSYFESEKYSDALGYYQEALILNEENPDYFRDYAIALARLGRVDEAEEILEKAEEKKIRDEHIFLVKAEINLSEGKEAEAIEYFEKAIAMAEDDYVRIRAKLLCARAYGQMQEYVKEIQILEEARKENTQEWYLTLMRALGDAYAKEALWTEDEDDSLQCYIQASECYEEIVKTGTFGFRDQMNLSILYQASGELEKARSELEKMEEVYSEEYEIYMRMALVLCGLEGEKPEEQRDYLLMEAYYKKAEDYYNQELKYSGKSDEKMQNLEMIMKELYENGWI